jgi:hypothetical protein
LGRVCITSTWLQDEEVDVSVRIRLWASEVGNLLSRDGRWMGPSWEGQISALFPSFRCSSSDAGDEQYSATDAALQTGPLRSRRGGVNKLMDQKLHQVFVAAAAAGTRTTAPHTTLHFQF